MALPVTKTFVNTNGTALAAHDAGWTVDNGAIQIQSNRAQSTTTDGRARWTTDAPDADQKITGKFDGDNGDGGNYAGVCTRLTSGGNGYAYASNYGAHYLVRIDSGTATVLSTGTGGIVPADTMMIQSEGSLHTCELNGSTTNAPSAQTDSTYSAAAEFGLFYLGTGTNSVWESVTMDNLAAGGGATGKSNPLMGCFGGSLSGAIA